MNSVDNEIGAFPDLLVGKRIVVTGGAGSVGTELVDQLLRRPVELVRVIDNSESGIFRLQELYSGTNHLEALFCDIRDEHELNRAFSGINICFHAAALKHVPSCELSPFSAVQTNIIGTQQVIRASLHNGLTHVVITSSDKAVNPTNVMGTSKLMAERLFTAANALSEGSHRCLFSSTRFGNVAGSQGSVIPLFCDQIRRGQDLTLTHPQMSRFVMTLKEAAGMLIESIGLAYGGEIFIPKVDVMAVKDLARVLVRLIAPLYGRTARGVRIRQIGPRPGEKMWEELNTDEEVRRTYDLGRYLVVVPALRNFYGAPASVYGAGKYKPCEKIYHSANEPPMSEADIERFLLRPGVLPAEIRGRIGLEIQEPA